MEEFILENDIHIVCVTADSFPDGVMAAHGKLHKLVPFEPERRYFGISWGGEHGAIHYQAGVEILKPEEASISGTTPFTIRKGRYMSVILKDYMKDIQSIGQAFNELLAQDNIDPNGYCVEWYISKEDVRCMVPLK